MGDVVEGAGAVRRVRHPFFWVLLLYIHLGTGRRAGMSGIGGLGYGMLFGAAMGRYDASMGT